MRGKVDGEDAGSVVDRITPAYAGKSQSTLARFSQFQDHPRLCGEKMSPFNMVSITIGSPPPMRGKVLNAGGFCKAVRITPAYAGKRWANLVSPVSRRDHPRLCGEKSFAELRSDRIQGSPPPMRGKVVHSFIESITFGITPAYAGKSRHVELFCHMP